MAPFIGRAAEALDLWSQAPTAFTLFELWRKIIGLIKQSADVDDGGACVYIRKKLLVNVA